MGIRKLCETQQKKGQRKKLQCWYILHSPLLLLVLHLPLSSPHTHPRAWRYTPAPFLLGTTRQEMSNSDYIAFSSAGVFEPRPVVKATEEAAERGNHFVLEAWLC